eukprot:2065046-Amphidinium_carterae.1
MLSRRCCEPDEAIGEALYRAGRKCGSLAEVFFSSAARDPPAVRIRDFIGCNLRLVLVRMAESFVFDNYSSLSKVLKMNSMDTWPPVLASTVGPWFAQVLVPLLVSSEGRLMMRACATTLQVSEPSVADPGDVIQFVKSAMSGEIRDSLTRIYEVRMRRKVFMNKMQDVPLALRDLVILLSSEVSHKWNESEGVSTLKIEPDFSFRVLRSALLSEGSASDFSVSSLLEAVDRYEVETVSKLEKSKRRTATMIVLQSTRELLADGRTRVTIVHSDPLVAIDKVIGG